MGMRETLDVMKRAGGFLGALAGVLGPQMDRWIAVEEHGAALMEKARALDLKEERPMKSGKWWRRRNKARWKLLELMEESRRDFRETYADRLEDWQHY